MRPAIAHQTHTHTALQRSDKACHAPLIDQLWSTTVHHSPPWPTKPHQRPAARVSQPALCLLPPLTPRLPRTSPGTQWKKEAYRRGAPSSPQGEAWTDETNHNLTERQRAKAKSEAVLRAAARGEDAAVDFAVDGGGDGGEGGERDDDGALAAAHGQSNMPPPPRSPFPPPTSGLSGALGMGLVGSFGGVVPLHPPTLSALDAAGDASVGRGGGGGGGGGGGEGRSMGRQVGVVPLMTSGLYPRTSPAVSVTRWRLFPFPYGVCVMQP